MIPSNRWKRLCRRVLLPTLSVLLIVKAFLVFNGPLSRLPIATSNVHNIFENITMPLLKPSSQLNRRDRDSMEHRRKVIQQVCDANPEFKSYFRHNAVVSPKHKFLYCGVPKVACTFWGRFMYQLMFTDPMESPFDISVSKGFGLGPRVFFTQKAKGNETLFQELIAPMTKFLFVRDPLSRVFSAYVDKLLAPNPILWSSWAVPAVMSARSLSKEKIKNCGKDVTFSEFASHVANSLSFKDPHVIPIHRQCPPCTMNFTIIGKMETAAKDTKTVLDALDIKESQIHLDRMSEDAAIFALEDSSRDSLSKSWLDRGCAKKEEVLKRILRKLQIRGFISWRFKYRIPSREAEDMTFDKFLSILKSAREEYHNKTELSIQKKQSFSEAFHQLSQKQMDHLKNTYKVDILLFDYDDAFHKVERMRSQPFVDTHAFDFHNDWDLSALL